jgi:hypothetical protein
MVGVEMAQAPAGLSVLLFLSFPPSPVCDLKLMGSAYWLLFFSFFYLYAVL